MRKKVILCLIFLLSYYCPIYGLSQTSSPTQVNIGYTDTLKQSTLSLMYKDTTYPVYTFLDTLYIPLHYFESPSSSAPLQMKNLVFTEGEPKPLQLKEQVPMYLKLANFYSHEVNTYTLYYGEDCLIPLNSILPFYDYTFSNYTVHLETKLFEPMHYVVMDDDSITNCSSYTLHLKITDFLWDNKTCIQHQRTLDLDSFASCSKTSFMDELPPSTVYLGSLVTEVNGLSTDLPESLITTLHNQKLYSLYFENLTKLPELDALFQPTFIHATLKYPIGKLKTDEKVTILWAEKRRYYVIQDTLGKEHLIPWNSLKIAGRSWYPSSPVSTANIEDYANIKNLTSDTNYYIWTDLGRHKTYVLKKHHQKWCLDQHFVCATGKDKNPTPSGHFKIQYPIPYFGLDHGYQCKYALVFFRDFMYHSVLFDKSGTYVVKSQLGMQASSGCVRLSAKDSKWLYDTIPVGTTVWIH